MDLERAATHAGALPPGALPAVAVPGAATCRWRRPTPRAAFDATVAFLTGARAPDGGPATFLIDEVLEFRTFENFPGLRHIMRDLLGAIVTSGNRFVLTTRYVSRALRLLRDAAPRLRGDPRAAARPAGTAPGASRRTPMGLDAADMARAVHALTDGHAGHAHALLTVMTELSRHGGSDPVSALAAAFEPGAPLASRVGWCYELRLHRARGYGALKGILGILAEEEPLTLTEIAQRLQRTPGSTKDYLSWLEDVDLVNVRQKRYTFADPAAAAVGAPALPSRAADRGRHRERGPPVRARTPAAGAASPRWPLAAGGDDAGDEERKTWGDHRDRLSRGARPVRVRVSPLRTSLTSARRAASCSASFFVRPLASASVSPATRTSTWNSLS